MKILYVHVGPGKTGSSAIQVFLAQASDLLADRGIFYPSWDDSNKHAAVGRITSGNGTVLCRYLGVKREKGLQDWEVEERLGEAASNPTFTTLLMSSELLQTASAEGLLKLQTLTTRIGIELRVIYYLRSAFDLYVSTYNQAVKRSAFTGTLEEFVKQKSISQYVTLRTLISTLGTGQVDVRSYECAKENIKDDFLRAIGVFESISDTFDGDIVNPSLSAIDTNIMRSVNRFLASPQDGHFLSDLMLGNAKYLGSGVGNVGPSKESCQLIRSRHLKDYEWVTRNVGEGLAGEIFSGEQVGDQGPDLEGSAAHLARFVGLLAIEMLRLRRTVNQLSGQLKRVDKSVESRQD